jgi:hypothetical protein
MGQFQPQDCKQPPWEVHLAIGIGTAVGQNMAGPNNGADEKASSAELDPKNLPVEVLKALPPEELAELFPEKAEAILVPEAFGQVKTTGSEQNDPKYLRAVIQKLGGEAPESASTKELQDILANLSGSPGPPGK